MDKSFEIEVEGHRMAAVLAHPGDSDVPVFFLHGIGGSVRFWTPELTAPFYDTGPCYSLSLPGHFPAVFRKGFPAECLTAELIARLVSNTIRKTVGNRKALLVGHSTGGFAALCTAIYHPEVVEGVISIAGFAQGQWAGVLGFCQWLVRQGAFGRSIFKTVYHIGGLHPSIFRMYWQGYVNDHRSLLKSPDFKMVADAMLPYFQKLDMEAMVSYFTVMPHTDITSCLPEISVPTCLIVGDEDPIVPPKQSSIIAETVTGAELFLIKGSGHLPFFERTVEYKRAIEAWLTTFQSRCLS
jgi:pimeloyl-ACP methyl ester carboxylesterase